MGVVSPPRAFGGSLLFPWLPESDLKKDGMGHLLHTGMRAMFKDQDRSSYRAMSFLGTYDPVTILVFWGTAITAHTLLLPVYALAALLFWTYKEKPWLFWYIPSVTVLYPIWLAFVTLAAACVGVFKMMSMLSSEPDLKPLFQPPTEFLPVQEREWKDNRLAATFYLLASYDPVTLFLVFGTVGLVCFVCALVVITAVFVFLPILCSLILLHQLREICSS